MIPKKIHSFWYGDTKLHDLLKKCIKSWSMYNPSYEIKVWEQDDYPESRFFNEAKSKKLYRKMSNYSRLKKLYDQGGIYLDTDIQLLKPLDKFLKHNFFVGSQGDSHLEHYVNNAVIGCVPKHPAIKELIEKIENASVENDKDFSSGPELLTAFMKEKGFNFPITNTVEIGNMTLYPSSYFYPFSWLKQNESINSFIKSNTYSIHWWWSELVTYEDSTFRHLQELQ